MPEHLSKHYPENCVSMPEPLFRMNASSIFLFGSYKYDKSQHCLIKRFVWLFYVMGSLLSVNESEHVYVFVNEEWSVWNQ